MCSIFTEVTKFPKLPKSCKICIFFILLKNHFCRYINTGNINENLSGEDLLKQLQKSTAISCKNVTFRFVGLSLATINTIISITLSVIMFRVIKNYGKNK